MLLAIYGTLGVVFSLALVYVADVLEAQRIQKIQENMEKLVENRQLKELENLEQRTC
jgi:hypothetical protein